MHRRHRLNRQFRQHRLLHRRRLPAPRWRKISIEYYPQLSVRVGPRGKAKCVEFTVPAAALAGLEPGSLVLWQVELILPEGRRIVSETFATRLE